MTEKTCPRCGSAVVAGAHFCSSCGHDVSGEQDVVGTVRMTPPAGTPPPPDTLEPLRQATVGEYDVMGELGRGGMATVYLAHDIALDRKVAIKVMAPNLTSGAGMVERFKREARTAASLSHPHIIPIYAVREMQNLLFFVMKYVEGRSLDSIIREQGRLPVPLVQAIMAQVGGALGYAHRRGIVHRDIKPANIMIDDEGWAVVTDFGIAKVADARGLTMTGVTIGTPSFMSPEQCASKPVTGATDQYSLGIVLYEMLAGKVPFEADSLMGIMWKHFNEPPPPLLDARPDCPVEITQAVERMLAKDPKDRWPTMEDAVSAIGQPSMAPDGPVRQQMRGLSKGGLGETLREQVHTPASPIPSGPVVSPDAPTIPSGPLDVPAGMGAPPTPPPVSPTGAPPQQTGGPPSYAQAATDADTPTIKVDDAYAEQIERTRPTPATVPVAAQAAEAAPAAPARAARPRRGLLYGGLAAVAAISAGAVWLVLGMTGGGGGPATDGTGAGLTRAPVHSVLLQPPTQSIAAGQQGDLIATVLDSLSNLISDRPITWQSSDTGVVRVVGSQGAKGLFEGVKAGTATIVASSEGKSAEATVTVTEGRATVASVVVPGGAIDLAPGDSTRLRAEPKDASGSTLGGRAITWRASDPGVARVSSAGFLIGVGDGRTSVTATSEGKTSTPVTVTVKTPAIASVAFVNAPRSLEQGTRQPLRVRVLDARNRPVRSFDVAWTSSNDAFATVSDDGQITARAPGNVTVTATVAGVKAETSIRVTPPPAAAPTAPAAVAKIAVSPEAVSSLDVDKSVSLTAMTYDEADRPLTRTIEWRSSNPAVATVEGGTVTARSPGKATITAASGGKNVSVEITVNAPTAAPTQTQPVTPPPESPTTPAAPAAAMTMISAGTAHTCGVVGGAAVCWGSNDAGEAGGSASAKSVPTPTSVAGAAGLESVVSGSRHSCGLTSDGRALCWGSNADGQLGNGNNKNSATPVPVAGNHRFRQLAAGADHTCGVATDGKAWCWGKGNDGELGNKSTRSQNQPVAVDRDITYTQLAAGEKHTCGVATDGKGYCWGDGYSDQLGIGIQDQLRSPDEPRLSEPITAIVAGKESTCAIGKSGATYCWGRGFSGTPRQVDTKLRFRQLAVGQEFACGETAQGAVWCWGKGDKGQLGNGATKDSRAPVQVNGTFKTIAAGDAYACGVTTGGEVMCWGENARGQLGTGGTQRANAPTPVQSVRR
jgi:serine/threonine protein kinase/alpha-tubulin suppressor-like RCC1 family protein/uncharacterized protein YjdB